MKPINKTVFLKSLDCPVYAWHLYRGLVPKSSTLSNEFLIMESANIRSMARIMFPEGVWVSGSVRDAVKKTKELINDENIKTIFDPVFEYNGFVSKIDILTRDESGAWQIIDIKAGGKGKKKYISDMAYESLVASKTLPFISKVVMFLLSKDFRLGKPVEELFSKIDCSEEVFAKAKELEDLFPYCKEIVYSKQPKEKYLKLMCKNCALFPECTGKDIEYHIFDLPRLSQLVFDKLAEMKIWQVKDIPPETELKPLQKIVKDCILNNKIFINPELKNELKKIVFPAYYLDFESVMTIYPLYKDIAPHSQITTQYSVHKCDAIDHITDHFEYIADHKRDCRRTIAQNLIDIFGDTGSIITYSSFEKNIILKLGNLYPDLLSKLELIADRIVDFEEILRNNYYDRRFHGRTSIKKVLPIMIPEMNYDSLKIGEGEVALSAFAYMAMGLYNEDKIKETKKNLLEYCKQDTLALVEMHKFLAEVAENSQKADTLGIDSSIVKNLSSRTCFSTENSVISKIFKKCKTFFSIAKIF